jgi:hypothetical protein
MKKGQKLLRFERGGEITAKDLRKKLKARKMFLSASMTSSKAHSFEIHYEIVAKEDFSRY